MVTHDMAKNQNTRVRKGSSSISGFYKMGLKQRLEELRARGVLDHEDVELLSSHRGGLPLEVADQMIENVIGVMELPLGLGLNFQINQKDYVVPMSVEEPSIVAAVSHVAKLARDFGGFTAQCEANVMIGQIQVVGVPDLAAAKAAVLAAKPDLLARANAPPPEHAAPRRRRQGPGGPHPRPGQRLPANAGGPPPDRLLRRHGRQPHQHHGRRARPGGRGADRRPCLPAHPLKPGRPTCGPRLVSHPL